MKNIDLFSIVDKHCSTESHIPGFDYYDLIKLDIDEYGKNIYYCVDTFDLYNYVNPHYFLSFINNKEQFANNKESSLDIFLLRSLAYEMVFKKLGGENPLIKLILAEEYELEFDGLGANFIYDDTYNDQFGNLIKDKIKFLIKEVNNPQIKLETNLVLQFLQLSLQFSDPNYSNLRQDKIKFLIKIIIDNKKDVINKFMQQTKTSKNYIPYFKKYAESIKFKLIGRSKNEKYKILNSALNDIKVIDKIINGNNTISNELYNIGKLRYFSSSPLKTNNLIDIIKSCDIPKEYFDFNRNIYHIFFIQNILGEVLQLEPDLSSSALIEIGKKILNPNSNYLTDESDLVKALRKKISSNIENQYGIFYSNILNITAELRKVSSNEDLINKISRFQIKNKSESIKSLFLSANNLRFVDLLSTSIKSINNNNVNLNLSKINEFDPIKNSFHSFPFLIFISIPEIIKNIPSFYEIFNEFSNYEKIDQDKIIILINSIISESLKLNSENKYYDSNLIDLFIIYFFSLFYTDDSNILSSKIEISIDKLQEAMELIKYSSLSTQFTDDKISLLDISKNNSIRELRYLLLWIERKNYFTNNENIERLLKQNSEYINLYKNDPRFWHGRALLKILQFEKEAHNQNDENNVNNLNLIESIFSDYKKAIKYYSILKKENVSHKYIYTLVCKSIVAIKNSIIYKMLYVFHNIDKNKYSLTKIRECLKSLKKLCDKDKITYDKNPSFCHTEFSLELLEIIENSEIYTIHKLEHKIYHCRQRYYQYLSIIKDLNVLDYQDTSQIINKSKLAEIFSNLKDKLKTRNPNSNLELLFLQLDILLVKIKRV